MRTGHGLLGRDAELARLWTALDRVADGGRCVLVHGDAGIGKSVLVDALAEGARADGRAVLATGGVRSETHLPFAALHKLLDPVLSGVDRLPEPLRGALFGALGREEADVGDVMAVALAALDLVRRAGAPHGALVVVEDAQWLDRSSADVLGFVARRIGTDPILLVASDRRWPSRALPDVRFERIAVGPLGDAAARDLVQAQAPALDPRLRDQLVGEAAGNPLALVELAVAWSALPPGTIVDSLVPVTDRLIETFASRAGTLPPQTRDLVLVAAVADGEGLTEIVAAAAALGHSDVTHDDLYPAVEARLVEVGPRGVRFRHPLVRSTVYEQAGEAARRAAHAALAAVIADRDRAAWHRAAALVEPDEVTAAALEGAGDRARRRGAPLVAATAYERAAALSPDPSVRGRRLVRAAYHAHELGRHDVVVRLLDEAEAAELTPGDRARAAWRRELLAGDEVADERQVTRLVDVIGRMREAGDVDLAIESLVALATQAYWRGLGAPARARLVAAAEALPVGDDPRLLHVLGMVAPIERGDRVRAGLGALSPTDVDEPGVQVLLGVVAGPVGDHEAAVAFLTVSVRALRATGRLGDLTNALIALAWAHWHRGTWDEGSAAADEAARLGELTERPGTVLSTQLLQALLAAVRGDTAGAIAVTDGLADQLRAAGLATLVAMVEFVRGTALAAEDRDDEAYDAMRTIEAIGSDDTAASIHQGTAAAYVDAALATGRVAAARSLVDDLEALGATFDSPILAATLAYVRPLVADHADAAEHLFAIADRDLVAWPFLRARARLAHGIMLRRRRRAADARPHLRAARDLCDHLGARPWAARARRELRAAGEASPRRGAGTEVSTEHGPGSLTAQELEIARLASSGLTNREIGRRLHLSHRTVGSHLYHLFPKLGVTSRGELSAALAVVPGESDAVDSGRSPAQRPAAEAS